MAEIEMQAVTSSQIAEVGYDAETQKLRVRFVRGSALYEYDAVPQDVYDNLVNAPSVGAYHAQVIKYGYNYKRIE